jgi:hypothetical protein
MGTEQTVMDLEPTPTAPSTIRTGVINIEGGLSTAGASTWWRLSGYVDVATLHNTWLHAGLNPDWLPNAPSAATALRRSMRSHEARRLLARPLDGGEGWLLVRERLAVDSDTAYEATPLLRVSVNAAEDGADVSLLVEHTEELEQVALAIRNEFGTHLDRLAPEDVSVWLSRMMVKLDAVALRDTGGIYFVPNGRVELLRAIAMVLRAVTAHVVYEMPAIKSEGAVEAILAAVESEAVQAAKKMEGALSDGALGARGLANREEQCREVERKVAGYESLLGRSLDGLRERLEKLRANIAVAIMAARADADEVT